MKAKTIFLNNLDETIVYDTMWHNDNHENYMKKYYSNLIITEYIPLILINYNHCVIDLSKPYSLGVVYLPSTMSNYQKEYFYNNKNNLEKYSLYLNGYSNEKTILMNEILNIIDSIPIRKKKI